MTNMHFPFGDEAGIVAGLLANHGYEAVTNHRGQSFYRRKMVWQGRLVTCRMGRIGLCGLPGDLYEEVWCGYYDANEPDCMLDDAVHPNVFAFIKKHHLRQAA